MGVATLGFRPGLRFLRPPGAGIAPALPYLDPAVGYVTTPDPGPLPNECTFVWNAQGPTTTADNTIAAQWSGAAGNRSWWVAVRSNGPRRLIESPDGTAAPTRTLDGPIPAPGPEQWAMTVNQPAGLLTLLQHTDGAWLVVDDDQGAALTLFDSSLVLGVGATSPGGSRFAGRVYSAELRTGLDPTAGSVVWRFDANEYPGSGTTYTDPRGRVWTLTNPAAIVRP